MINALFVLIVFLLTLKKDYLHIKWPFGVKTNITYDESSQEVTYGDRVFFCPFYRQKYKESRDPEIRIKSNELCVFFQARIAKELIELRNKSVFAFFMFNALFVLVVFLLQLNKDQIHVKWPLGIRTNITFIEETSEVFTGGVKIRE